MKRRSGLESMQRYGIQRLTARKDGIILGGHNSPLFYSTLIVPVPAVPPLATTFKGTLLRLTNIVPLSEVLNSLYPNAALASSVLTGALSSQSINSFISVDISGKDIISGFITYPSYPRVKKALN